MCKWYLLLTMELRQQQILHRHPVMNIHDLLILLFFALTTYSVHAHLSCSWPLSEGAVTSVHFFIKLQSNRFQKQIVNSQCVRALWFTVVQYQGRSGGVVVYQYTRKKLAKIPKNTQNSSKYTQNYTKVYFIPEIQRK